MKALRNLFVDDLTQYQYLMSTKSYENYTKNKLLVVCISFFICFIFAYVKFGIHELSLAFVAVMVVLSYKAPYVFLKLQHLQMCNEIISAIPLWVNTIYALINENNIYNSILKSYESAPESMKRDLGEFIKKIEVDASDKDAYIHFLSRYQVDGFREIMMKLYEFRNLSKEKLKYEIADMNRTLGKIETMKRENRHRSEIGMVDILNLVMFGIPCIYMYYVSMLSTNSLFNL